MDEVDYANELADKWLQQQLAAHAYQLGHAVHAYESGRCRNCEEKLDDSRAFCDTSCQKDWEDRYRASKRNGRYRGG